MGLTQHKNTVATIQELVNLHLLLGAIGRDSAGLCPVRGHNNGQGDRTMGVFEKMPEWFLSNLEREFQLKTARQHGYDTVTSIMSMHEGEANVFYAFSGDYIQATPYTVFTSLTLLNCYLTVHICTKLNRSHVITGRTDLILPCLGRSEKETRNRVGQFLTVENSMSVVHASHGKLHPASPNLLSEPEIVARKAAATALSSRSRTPWLELGTNCNQIRDLLARVAPGFENFHESSPQQRVERRPSAGVRQANVYRP